MAARRHSPLFGVACLAVGALLVHQALDASFVASRQAVVRGRVPRAAFESGKLNLGVELGDSKTVPVPVLEANEATNLAIRDCLEEGCDVSALMNLDAKLARDEDKIRDAMLSVKDVQKTAFSQDNTEALVWYDNFLQRMGGLRAQLQALSGHKETDFVRQLVKAAAVGFGGGRETDYPKVGVSPYSA
jgi:hypothetical protein